MFSENNNEDNLNSIKLKVQQEKKYNLMVCQYDQIKKHLSDLINHKHYRYLNKSLRLTIQEYINIVLPFEYNTKLKTLKILYDIIIPAEKLLNIDKEDNSEEKWRNTAHIVRIYIGYFLFDLKNIIQYTLLWNIEYNLFNLKLFINENNINIDYKDGGEHTVLRNAISYHEKDVIIDGLLELKADPTIKDWAGESAISASLNCTSHETELELFANYHIDDAKKLMEHKMKLLNLKLVDLEKVINESNLEFLLFLKSKNSDLYKLFSNDEQAVINVSYAAECLYEILQE
jgi:hypothetical protein